ncbi:MAG: T9SS type A sorting domain-containing protein [Saprospiraceae bacterium]|nr:T9SS type A sorting domain-containing protein [Saprospiraceae bacterium]
MCNRLFSLLLLCAACSSSLAAQRAVNPLVHNGIVVALSDNVNNYIFAPYLVLEPSPDSCVNYAFSNNPNDLVRNFKCDELGTQPLTIWTFSAGALRPTATRTYALIQDNLGDCPGWTGGQKPIVCCRNGLALALNGGGEITVTPDMWDLSTAVCNNDPNIQLSFSADPTDTTLTLDCFYAGGINIIQIWATGSTGQQNYAEVYFQLQDYLDGCSGNGNVDAPIPQATMGSSITLNYNGQAIVHASELDAGSYADSSTCQPLRYSFSADTNDVVRTYTCSTLGTKAVQLWVTDACGQQNYLDTYILVNDNGACGQLNQVPSNDNLANAISLHPENVCSLTWSNRNTTTEANEPVPSLGDCSDPNTWCDSLGAEHSVWFTFAAPASGTVLLNTAGMNTQLAVWELLGGDMVLVAANDDLPGNAEGASGLSLSCLEAGKTYWIQIDGHNGAVGQFTLEFGMSNLTCAVSGQNEQALACGAKPVTPIQSTGTGAWQYLLDADQVPVAAINDRGNALGQITADFMINGDTVRTDAAGNHYLDRNWTINVQNQPQTPVWVKFFLTKDEWERLANTSGGPTAPNLLHGTKVSGSSCGNYEEGGTLLTNQGSYAVNAGGDLANLYEISSFSSFYLHGGNTLTGTRSPRTLPLAVYPNPAHDAVRLVGLPESADGFQVTLTDIAGHQVYQALLPAAGLSLALPALPAGFYLLQATDGQQLFSGKLTIE